jgi:hypothetical protein
MYARDLLDAYVADGVDGEDATDAIDVLALPGVRHALAFRRTWRAVYGVAPSALDHADFCSFSRHRPALGLGSPHSGGQSAALGPSKPDLERLARFLQTERQLRVGPLPSTGLDAYLARLEAEPAFLFAEVMDKLRDRYGVTEAEAAAAEAEVAWPEEDSAAPNSDADCRRRHEAVLRAASALETTYPGRARAKPPLDVNPCTGHRLPAPVPESVRLMYPGVHRREALKYAFSRDYLFVSTSVRAKCACVGTGALAGDDSADAATLLQSLSDASCFAAPYLILSHKEANGARVAALDFYHHKLVLNDADEYDAVPQTFDQFVVADCATSRLLSRPLPPMGHRHDGFPPRPLCRAPGGSLALRSRSSKALQHLAPPGYRLVSHDPNVSFDAGFYAPRASDDRMGGFAALAWRGLLARRSPADSRLPADGALLHQQYMLRRCALQSCRYALDGSSDKCVVLVENRAGCDGAAAVLSAATALANLPPGWGLRVICPPAVAGFYRAAFAGAGATEADIISTHRLHSRNFNIECYNAFMKREDTWAALLASGCRRALTVQSDGTLARPGLEEHPAFQGRYSYAGAPWAQHPYLDAATRGNLVGNGGFSLRDVAECARVCREHDGATLYPMAPGMSQPEDVFFAQHCASPCPGADAVSFSMEQVPYARALGYHDFWRYHAPEFAVAHFRALAAELLVERAAARA